tara:strand:- start:61 stop:924 length:864 start_codon:yes stop_codon:yes gene_type:complete
MKKHIIIILLLTITQISFGQNTILWKITDTINNRTSIILGTFHQFGNSFVDSIPEIKENLYNSELAIFESIDNKDELQKTINNREESKELKKRLKKIDYLRLLELSKNWKVDIHKLKPIELRWKLEQEFLRIKCKTVMKKDKWDHFDNYLQHLAEEKNIKILGLETHKEQLVFINKDANFPNWKEEKKRTSYLLDQFDRDDFNKNKCILATKYRNYDLDYKLNKECKQGVLIKERNDNWMKILPQILKEKKCFIAVGLFHLYNKCGLLEQLKEEGFLIEPIELIASR